MQAREKKRIQINVSTKKLLADTITPVNIYLRLRDRFPHSLLLESTDYRGAENSYSFICCNPIASFRVVNNTIDRRFPDRSSSREEIRQRGEVVAGLQQFINSFEISEQEGGAALLNGLFGYSSFDAIQYFEDIELKNSPGAKPIPVLSYALYEYVIAINHFKNEMQIIRNLPEGVAETGSPDLEELERLMRYKDHPFFPFAQRGSEVSNMDEAEHAAMIERCKTHIFRGDVFQIVPSRRFSQQFQGDEFNVYRALRSINPSPYLFYFDFGGFKIFGSSPEAQIVVKNRKASIYPIAGTYRRTGDDEADSKLAEKLRADPKENAEHVMLVDLARNDLSKHCTGVNVEAFKEVHFYSHVIHLVSKVTGAMRPEVSAIEILSDTFPAGTLSGAPKYKAVELIDRYERGRRGFYGGALGYLGFNGDCNHAIIIRSFLSQDNVLHFQAGGGVVADSDIASEVAEVRNKLSALRSAIDFGEKIYGN